MKKKLIALAIAGAMTAPMAAMADVKISGGLQSQVGSISNGDTNLRMGSGGIQDSNGQDFGTFGAMHINASESLGGGMTALASYGFNIQTGGGINTRQAFVGLSGDFGTVLAGQIQRPYTSSTVGWDPFLGTFMQARGNGGMGGSFSSQLYGGEMPNVLAYANEFGGVRLVAGVVVDQTTENNHAYSFSINAPVGPVELAFAHIDASEHGSAYDGDDGPALANVDKAAATKVGVRYSAGDLTVAGQYEMFDDGLGDGNAMFMTASYKIGANTLSASVGMEDEEVGDRTYMAFGVLHALSQKSRLHAGIRMTDWDNGDDETAIGAGLRVSF